MKLINKTKILYTTIILFIIFIIYLLFKNFEKFNNIDANLKETYKLHKQNMSNNSEKSNLSYTNIKTDTMNVKGAIGNSLINLDSNSSDKNINVKNDIIVKKKFRLDGYNYDIDIPFLRYLKYLPVHFQKEICLMGTDGSDCINKKHIEIIKGERKINLKTYPENIRKCLGTKDIQHKPGLYSGKISNFVFSSNDCKNGDLKNEFLFVREPHSHDSDGNIHYHDHIIDNAIKHNT